MANLSLYKSFFGLDTTSEIKNEFQKSLVTTNRSFLFYVDWEKVKKNINQMDIELNLLDSLINSKNLKTDFFKLLSGYTEVVKVLPILLAIRESTFDIIEKFDEKMTHVISYSFKKKKGEKL